MIRLTKLETCLHSTYSNRYKVNTFLLIKEFFSIFFPENSPPLNFADFQVFTQFDSIFGGRYQVRFDIFSDHCPEKSNNTSLYSS